MTPPLLPLPLRYEGEGELVGTHPLKKGEDEYAPSFCPARILFVTKRGTSTALGAK